MDEKYEQIRIEDTGKDTDKPVSNGNVDKPVSGRNADKPVSDGNILQVAEVNARIKKLLEGSASLKELSVRGELSNYKIYPSGHHYFTLKDSAAALRCVMFHGRAAKLLFRPVNGMSVIASGAVTVFPRDGSYQLNCAALIPEGVGELALAFEQLKAKLSAEGLFDPARKKPLPRYPERIAVITSSAGAAVHDMIRILRQRFPGAKVILLPVRVQGVEAPPEIAGAIRYANRYNIGDVIITGRGGGSMEELWAFNDERVARAIAASQIPVVSAVGHEPDVTISDFVADMRASTPTNAAQIVVPDRTELLRWLNGAQERMGQAMEIRITSLQKHVAQCAEKRVLRDPLAPVRDRREKLLHLRQRLGDLANAQFSIKKQQFLSLTAALDAMSPLKVLERGYAMVQDSGGRIVKNAADIVPGESVSVTLGQGSFTAIVHDTRPATDHIIPGTGTPSMTNGIAPESDNHSVTNSIVPETGNCPAENGIVPESDNHSMKSGVAPESNHHPIEETL